MKLSRPFSPEMVSEPKRMLISVPLPNSSWLSLPMERAYAVGPFLSRLECAVRAAPMFSEMASWCLRLSGDAPQTRPDSRLMIVERTPSLITPMPPRVGG